MLKNLVYTSVAVSVMNKKHLTQILRECMDWNIPNEITGMLVYHDGTFLQALEGNNEKVDEIYSKIVSDSRHKNITKLLDEPVDARYFSKWEMAFRAISEEEVKMLDRFIPLEDLTFKASVNSGHAKMILNTFYDLNVKSNKKHEFNEGQKLDP